MWNMGPELRYAVSPVIRCTMATVPAWVRIDRWESSAPLGVPPNAPV